MTNIYVETETPEYYDVTIKGVQHLGIEKSSIRYMIERLDKSNGSNVWLRGVNHGDMTKQEINEIVMQLDNLIHH
jgi:hypothetical protein